MSSARISAHKAGIEVPTSTAAAHRGRDDGEPGTGFAAALGAMVANSQPGPHHSFYGTDHAGTGDDPADSNEAISPVKGASANAGDAIGGSGDATSPATLSGLAGWLAGAGNQPTIGAPIPGAHRVTHKPHTAAGDAASASALAVGPVAAALGMVSAITIDTGPAGAVAKDPLSDTATGAAVAALAALPAGSGAEPAVSPLGTPPSGSRSGLNGAPPAAVERRSRALSGDPAPADHAHAASGGPAPADDGHAASGGPAPADDGHAASGGPAPADDAHAASSGPAPADDGHAASRGPAPADDAHAASRGPAPADDGHAASRGSSPADDAHAASRGQGTGETAASPKPASVSPSNARAPAVPAMVTDASFPLQGSATADQAWPLVAAGVSAAPAIQAAASPALTTRPDGAAVPSVAAMVNPVVASASTSSSGTRDFSDTARDGQAAGATAFGGVGGAGNAPPASGGVGELSGGGGAASSPSLGGDAGPVATQLSGQVLRLLANSRHEAVVRLYPPDLGEVTLRVAVSGRDVSAWFGSPQPDVQQSISSGLGQLQTDLGNAGYSLNHAWVGSDASGGFGARGDAPPPSPTPAPRQPAPITPIPATASSSNSGVSIYV